MNKFKKSYYRKINFTSDILTNKNLLLKKIFNKKILIIGGAGTIGSSYIKQVSIENFFNYNEVCTYDFDQGLNILLAQNGQGKTTLSKILIGIEPATEGEVILGHNAMVGYYAQNQAEALHADLDTVSTHILLVTVTTGILFFTHVFCFMFIIQRFIFLFFLYHFQF